jgi:hypothetical protein
VNVQDVIDGLFSGNPQQAPAEASVDYVALANRSEPGSARRGPLRARRSSVSH